MDKDKPTIVVRGYSLTEVEDRIIKKVSRDRAFFNDSAALRQIIREWAEVVQTAKAAEATDQ